MGLILDTGCFILAERAGPRAPLPTIADGEPVGISVVTLSELHVGIHLADSQRRRRIREAFIDRVLNQYTVFDFTSAIARIHAEIRAQLIRSGQMIGAHDLIIAATAVNLGWNIVTTNEREFRRIAGLAVVGVSP
jgi:tRNA(fMet)-specific endonuclease VapC